MRIYVRRKEMQQMSFTRNCQILKKNFTTIANISKVKPFFATATTRMKAISLNISR